MKRIANVGMGRELLNGTAAVQRAVWSRSLCSVQSRSKHYISYRLNCEDQVDPYVHLRRSRRRNRNQAAVMEGSSGDEDVAGPSPGSMATLLSSSVDAGIRELREKHADQPPVGMGMGTAGGLVQRSKGESLLTRGRPKNGAGGRGSGKASNGNLITPTEMESKLDERSRSKNGNGPEERLRNLKPIDTGLESLEQKNSNQGSDSPSLIPQSIKETGKKVLEKVEDAASAVGHKAKEMWNGTTIDEEQTHHRHQQDDHYGVVDAVKDVGKKTATVIDVGYDKAIETAVDKMLEALDVSLKRARARGFPPGLAVTSIINFMGAQLMVAYTTKVEDTKDQYGRKKIHKTNGLADSTNSATTPTRGRKSRAKSAPETNPSAEEYSELPR